MAELTFDRAGYVDLLRKLIGENRYAVRTPVCVPTGYSAGCWRVVITGRRMCVSVAMAKLWLGLV